MVYSLSKQMYTALILLDINVSGKIRSRTKINIIFYMLFILSLILGNSSCMLLSKEDGDTEQICGSRFEFYSVMKYIVLLRRSRCLLLVPGSHI